ncbi:MAG: hypothetical protein JWQ62_685 [Lacunisphaera sp.]|nr:hypothetical protein [Lacunisphaera sp.]
MADNPFTQTAAAPMAATPAPNPVADRAFIARSEPEVMRGANWFWWIAALSLVNTLMIHSDSDRNFVIGLGFTLMVDVMFKSIKWLAFGVDAVALGVIVGLGFLSRKGHFWAFVTGIVLYSLDALIYLALQDWMSVGFHGLALFYMIRGAKRLKQALREAAMPPAEPPPLPVVAG